MRAAGREAGREAGRSRSGKVLLQGGPSSPHPPHPPGCARRRRRRRRRRGTWGLTAEGRWGGVPPCRGTPPAPPPQEFNREVSAAAKEGEIVRILSSFKLIPYDFMGLRYDCTEEDARRRFRKVSLSVHPDKNKHPRAQEAFEAVSKAYEELKDPEAKERLDKALGAAREMLRKERRKLVRGDAAYAAAVAVAGGAEKLEAEHEASEGFHERWREKGREVMTKIEWRRRQMGKRMKEEEERADKEGREARARAKGEQKEFKTWEKRREERVGSWRDFARGRKKGAPGGLRPPKRSDEPSGAGSGSRKRPAAGPADPWAPKRRL